MDKRERKMNQVKWLTVRKGLHCAMRPSLWRHLFYGVSPTIEHTTALRNFAFRTIIDIGANRGQFTIFAARLFPNANIHSFEPLSSPLKTLRTLARRFQQVQFHCFAIGTEAGAKSIYVTSRDDSSSLLRPTAIQEKLFHTNCTRIDTVTVCRLSECISSHGIQSPALLKIDVQGNELDTLRASAELIHKFDALYIECSYVAMYEGQPLLADVSSWVEQHGFSLAGVYNQYDDRTLGAVQADFLFTRGKQGRNAS